MFAVHETSPASFSALQMISPMCLSGLKLLMVSVEVVSSVTMVISSLLMSSCPLRYHVSTGFGVPVKTTLWTTVVPCRARMLFSHSRKSGGSPRGSTCRFASEDAFPNSLTASHTTCKILSMWEKA